jgi:hypothetical protein
MSTNNSTTINKKDFLEATDILSQCNFTKLGTTTTEHPFFSPIKDEDASIEDVINRPTKDNTYIIDLATQIDLPRQLYNIYLMIDSNKREFSYDTFSFFSIDEINKRYNNFKANNQNDICDLACKYYGMGHIIVLSWNIKRKAFILRRDGGSNDYDRRDNNNFIINYDGNSTPETKRIPSDKLFKILQESKLEELRELFINL